MRGSLARLRVGGMGGGRLAAGRSAAGRLAAGRGVARLSTVRACGIDTCDLCGESSGGAPPSQRSAVSSLSLDRPALLVETSGHERYGALKRVGFEEIYGRALWDGVANEDECRRAAGCTRSAMLLASDSDGEGRLFPPDAPSAKDYLGESGLALIMSLRERVEERVAERYGPLERVGCLLSWISAGDGEARPEAAAAAEARSFNWLVDSVSGTYAPHVDRANQSMYDISSLLYLTSAATDFDGGLFAFNDPDADRLVEPTAGRMLAFCSGFTNLHQVRPVTAGDRIVLSTWFRRCR